MFEVYISVVGFIIFKWSKHTGEKKRLNKEGMLGKCWFPIRSLGKY